MTDRALALYGFFVAAQLLGVAEVLRAHLRKRRPPSWAYGFIAWSLVFQGCVAQRAAQVACGLAFVLVWALDVRDRRARPTSERA